MSIPIPKTKSRLAVLVSGQGTNLQALLDACLDSTYPAEVVLVISNNPEAFALQRAEKRGVPTVIIEHGSFRTREEFEEKIIERLDACQVDWIILAGFMRILSKSFIQRYPQKIINIHPSLLPAFPGSHAIRDAWDYGAKITGVTVHFVDEGVDTGPILFQREVQIYDHDSLKTLEKRVHSVEHTLFPEAIKFVCEKKYQVLGRKVVLHREEKAHE